MFWKMSQEYGLEKLEYSVLTEHVWDELEHQLCAKSFAQHECLTSLVLLSMEEGKSQSV